MSETLQDRLRHWAQRYSRDHGALEYTEAADALDALAAQLKEARANQYAARDALMWIMTEAHALELPDLATATPEVRWEIENAALAKEPTT